MNSPYASRGYGLRGATPRDPPVPITFYMLNLSGGWQGIGACGVSSGPVLVRSHTRHLVRGGKVSVRVACRPVRSWSGRTLDT